MEMSFDLKMWYFMYWASTDLDSVGSELHLGVLHCDLQAALVSMPMMIGRLQQRVAS